MKTTARTKQRYCIKCGTSITNRRPTAIYCKKCARIRQDSCTIKNQKERRQREKLEKSVMKE